MTKHTPGPWTFSYESIDPEWAVVTSTGGHIVANVNSESGPDIPPLVSHKMPQDANARLIAAAPELLSVLLQAVDASGFSLSGPTDSRAAEHGEPIWVCNARAAIAKATGKDVTTC